MNSHSRNLFTPDYIRLAGPQPLVSLGFQPPSLGRTLALLHQGFTRLLGTQTKGVRLVRRKLPPLRPLLLDVLTEPGTPCFLDGRTVARKGKHKTQSHNWRFGRHYPFHFLVKGEPSRSPSKRKYFKGRKIFFKTHKAIFLNL